MVNAGECAMEKRIAHSHTICLLHASRDPEAGNLRFPVSAGAESAMEERIAASLTLLLSARFA